jgi:AspT/YidE/YbjL antiporter-like protein
MNVLNILQSGNSIPGSLITLCLAGVIGILIGKISFKGISLGIGGVLFSSLLLGHMGFKIDPHYLEFIRETGLVFFVYTIGIQIGPRFFSSFKKEGIRLNILAAAIVAGGFAVAVCIHLASGLHIAIVAGIMSGAVTNTPGLGAAQQIISEYSNDALLNQNCGLGYAMAYPFGIIGIILVMTLLKKMCRIDVASERTAFEASSAKSIASADARDESNLKPDIIALTIGILAGVLIGIIPIKVPGIPIPLKLGIAGGPLLAALFLGKLRKTGPLKWTLPGSSNLVLRELGITMFLACVGLRSGEKFLHSLLDGEGLKWMLMGTLITIIPLIFAAFLSRCVMKMNFLAICGLLAGSMTDPPALSFAEKTTSSELPAVSYATVYALTMFLRITLAQLLVIIFMSD